MLKNPSSSLKTAWSNVNVTVEFCRLLSKNISRILLTIIFKYRLQKRSCLHSERIDVSVINFQKLAVLLAITEKHRKQKLKNTAKDINYR